MGTTYTTDDGEVRQILNSVIDEHFEDLKTEKVTFEILIASAEKDDDGDPKGPALLHNGWPAYATVKANTLKDRVAGLSDVRMIVDGDAWKELNANRRVALIHHELYHVNLKRKGMFVLRDDVNRPLIAMKPHDWQAGGFNAIAEMYGEDAIEWPLYQAMRGKKGKREKQTA